MQPSGDRFNKRLMTRRYEQAERMEEHWWNYPVASIREWAPGRARSGSIDFTGGVIRRRNEEGYA